MVSFGIKNIVKNSALYKVITLLRNVRSVPRTIAAWKKQGRPVPPPHAVKQRIVVEYGRRLGLQDLVETGTFMGEMINAVRKHFRKIYSIEVDEDFYQRAKEKFSKYDNIEIINGDSASFLPRLLETIVEPCLFWLDGHICLYAGGSTGRGSLDTPIVQELEAILTHPCHEHVVLIDDARLFTGHDDYPTVDAIREMVRRHRPEWTLDNKDDVIRIMPERLRERLRGCI